jgi:hypothetical protein
MTQPASLSLRAALIANAKANSGLQSACGGTVRFYEFVPERATLPYLQWRENARASDTTSDRGKEHEITINVWSRAEGRKEADQILHALETAWRDLAPQTLTDHRLVNIEFQMSDTIRTEGGQTYMGYARFRAVTEEL